MEKLGHSSQLLCTKLAYLSNIIVYYGYIHEGAELYRGLGKESREGWDSNLRAIAGIIMKDSKFRGSLNINTSFTKKTAKALLYNHRYVLFSLRILLTNRFNIDAATYLMK